MSRENSLGTVKVSLSPWERFEEFLQSRGKRITEQRRILVEHIFSHHEHFDADTLTDQLARNEELGNVSRPTVYRTLKELVDAGLLRKFELDGRDVYEHDYGYPQHDHLYCKKCQNLIEFQSEDLIELRNRVASEHSFRVSGHRFIISGVCDQCVRARRRVKRKVDLV